jgi:hypothetical protein
VFIVEPFGADSSIRSALGFMSLTSRWGALMFPGITVLTRDLQDLRAMHFVIVNQKRTNMFEPGRFMRKETDDLIADQLVSILKSGTRRDYNKQVMSYWQRYGSMVRYFNLFQSDEVPSVSRFRELVFSQNPRFSSGEPNDLQAKDVRAIRVSNAAWYRSFSDAVISKMDMSDIQKAFAEPNIRWWLTGFDSPAGLGVPKIIQLSRELEFALTVWQSCLEAATLLLKMKAPRVPSASRSDADPVPRFLSAITSGSDASDDVDRLSAIVATGLATHDRYFRSGKFAKWKKQLANWISGNFRSQQVSRYTDFHKLDRVNAGDVSSLAELPSSRLLDALSNIHVDYCHIQRKPHAIYIQDFKKPELGTRIPSVSASYNQSRWGLFGYRFDASYTLYRSRKYSTHEGN